MIITLKLLVWIAYVAFDVWINYRIIEVNKSRPNYLLMTIFRGVAFIVYGSFVWDFQYELWYLNVFIFCTTFFWITFDITLNLIRGKHWLYIGPESGWIDRWGVKNRDLYYVLKVMTAIVMVLSVINIYNP